MKKRVKIPVQDSKALIDLAKKVRDKHVVDGEASPLKMMNWASMSPLIDEALATYEAAENLKREKLRIFQQRNNQQEILLDIIRSSRDILSGVYTKQMKELGRWGFDVMDTRTTPADSSAEPLQKTV